MFRYRYIVVIFSDKISFKESLCRVITVVFATIVSVLRTFLLLLRNEKP
jgi:hypothetical protein